MEIQTDLYLEKQMVKQKLTGSGKGILMVTQREKLMVKLKLKEIDLVKLMEILMGFHLEKYWVI